MTGHKGLIGSFLLKRLIDEDHHPAMLVDLRDGSDIRNMDKADPEAPKEPIDMMIHLAALCKISGSIRNPHRCFQHNVIGTERVFEFCRTRGIPRIVFTSSSRVLSPERNPYTASKTFGEELLRGYSQSYGIEQVIVRPSTVYGPFNDLTRRLVDILMINALTGKPLEIYGDEHKTLDFTYVDDFTDAMMLAIEQRNDDFNVSGGREVNVGYVADLIIKLNGGGRKEFHPPETSQPQRVSVDIEKMRNLGYNPRVSIEEGIKRCFRYYRDNLPEILRSRGRIVSSRAEDSSRGRAVVN